MNDILEKIDKKDYIPVNSGSLHGFVYEVFVLSSANDMVKELGITKDEAIRRVKESVPKEDFIIEVHPRHAYSRRNT